ncbi:hypothetical protein ACP275_11G014700 [Erythranthe tilingii]
MAANTPAALLDKWRDYFRGANSDIFSIIEHAIMVAASDYPYDFKLKRDRIAEMLFTCKSTKCFGCDRIQLSVPPSAAVCSTKSGGDCDDNQRKSGTTHDGGSKESKVNSGGNYDGDDDYHREVMVMNVNQISDNSYGHDDVVLLTDLIDEENQFFEEVIRIKEIIERSEQESDEALFDSLRRLQLMRLSVEILKVTGIGKTVNSLRKHKSLEIRNLVKTLVKDWKSMVDDAWADAKAATSGADVTTECGKTSAVQQEEEEAGLPSPPLDEGAFFATPTSMEFSKFFDGIDDNGNPQNSGEFDKNRENGRERSIEESVLNKQVLPVKPSGPHNGESGPGRPKVALQSKVQQKSDGDAMQKKPVPNHQQAKLNFSNEDSVQTKLEGAKRKLQERYKEIANAKKQRTIQVVELNDLPKQNLQKKNQQTRPRNNRLRNC